jgi:hypothetical protein
MNPISYIVCRVYVLAMKGVWTELAIAMGIGIAIGYAVR